MVLAPPGPARWQRLHSAAVDITSPGPARVGPSVHQYRGRGVPGAMTVTKLSIPSTEMRPSPPK
jgi:hypothetical protein